MADDKTPAPRRHPKRAIRIGDKVSIKSNLRKKNGEVFEVVEIVTVTIMNERKRIRNIHISNLELI